LRALGCGEIALERAFCITVSRGAAGIRSGFARGSLAVVIAVSGCSSGTHLTLASYAAGRWRCQLVQPSTTLRLTFTANVSASSSTAGRVTFSAPAVRAIGSPGFSISGAWSVQKHQLVVRWDKSDPAVTTSTYAQPISLDTKQFQIKTDDLPDSQGQWVPVRVQRQAKAIVFSFALPGAPNSKLNCSKV
jgi:hypothetical protein